MRPQLLALALVLVGCASSPPRLRERIEQFVVAVDACMPDWFPNKPSLLGPSLIETAMAISSGDRRGLLGQVDCVVAAEADCVAVRACYGLRSSATSGPCNGAPPRCEGDELVQCIPSDGLTPTQISRTDCTHDGQSCIETADFVGCGLRPCHGSLPTRCEGDALVACNGVVEVPTPSPPNTTCRLTLGGGAELVLDGPACEETGCFDGHAITCDARMHMVVTDVDCASLGRTCRATSSAARCDPPPDAECSGTIPSCVGDSLRFCGSDQRLHDYDCAAHGFAGCELRVSPVFGSAAGCAPMGPHF